VPVAGQGTPETYASQLTSISTPVALVQPELEALIRRMVGEVDALGDVNAEAIAGLIQSEPAYVPILGSVVGLSQERLKRQLQARTGSAAWTTRAQVEPRTIVDLLDEEFGLVAKLSAARDVTYTFADVLIALSSRGAGAAGAIDSGRRLENQVQELVESLSLPYEARTRYIGTNHQSGPADFAIPSGGAQCRIAIGVKGFDSTGSKQTAARDEVIRMADVRRPDQYIYAVVDGLGWLGRMGDLRSLVGLVVDRRIDGIFALAEFDDFRRALRDAAIRVGVLSP
jgi:hypothetical protein